MIVNYQMVGGNMTSDQTKLDVFLKSMYQIWMEDLSANFKGARSSQRQAIN